MAHTTVHSGYLRLVDRLNRHPQGAPPSRVLYLILSMLFSEEEAGFAARLPLRPFTVKRAALALSMSERETRNILDRLAGRAVLIDIENGGETLYVLPPPMAGFFEFSLMRVRTDIDQKVLAGLFSQYLNVEEDFIRELFSPGETRLGRVFVQEPAVPPELSLQVLDYEKASEVILTSAKIGVGMCYCRHKMMHLDRACDAPMDICLTFNNTAASLIRHGIIREVSADKALDLLQQAYEGGLVQFGDNVREGVNFICNCCGCCCEAMIAARRFSVLHPVHTTNFLPEVDDEACTGCGKCIGRCPVEALSLVAVHDPRQEKRLRPKLAADICLGCGVCVRACPKEAVRLTQRSARVITPLNTAHRTVLMAIERGKLPELIFDSQALWSHRAMAAILGVILRLPPLKQAMASRQVRSRYLEALLSRWSP